MPAASVKLAEIRGKVVFEEHPALARLGRFEAALASVDAQHGGRHVQEASGLLQVETAHALLPFMAVQRHVVAPRLGLGLAADVAPQAVGILPHWVVVIGLQRVQEFAHPLA